MINLKNEDEYVHMVKFMLVKYTVYANMTELYFPLGDRIGRQKATQIRESWLWGQPADMMYMEWGWRYPGLRAQQERQILLTEERRETQATG